MASMDYDERDEFDLRRKLSEIPIPSMKEMAALHYRNSRMRSSTGFGAPTFSRADEPEEEIRCQEPPPVFSYEGKEFVFELTKSNESPCTEDSRFEEKWKQRWEAARSKHVMNYDLNLMYKLLPGQYRFTSQLNIERSRLRRKPHPFRFLEAPFDNRRFNYTKIKSNEILLDLRCADRPLTDDLLDRHLLIVNASPIEIGHSLIVPCVQRCMTQVMCEEALRLGVHLVLLNRHPRFIVLYNSLLAFASINHLHMHAIIWPYNSEITKRPVSRVVDEVYLLRSPEQWFTWAFVFQLTAVEQLDSFIRNCLKVFSCLHERQTAHNMFMTRAPLLRLEGSEEEPSNNPMTAPTYTTIYLFPRRPISGAKPMSTFNPAACELAGHLLIYSDGFFRTMTEQTIVRKMKMDAMLEEEQFAEILNSVRACFTRNGNESAKE